MPEGMSSSSQDTGVPAQIQLEDFVEAVSKGVLRALQAENDVSGFAAPNRNILINRPLIFGWIIGPDGGPFGQPGGDFGGKIGTIGQRTELG